MSHPPTHPYISELMREVEKDGNQVTEKLRNMMQESLDNQILDRCLIAATRNDNGHNVGKLVVKGARNLKECLDIATRDNKSKASAMLLMITAATKGDMTIVQKLFGETVEESDHSMEWFLDDNFKEVQKMAQTGTVPTVVAIELARRHGNPRVREALLLRTDVDEKEGTVYWHGLRLLNVEVAWLEKISWVRKFRLARNGLKVLPEDIGHYIQQVRCFACTFQPAYL